MDSNKEKTERYRKYLIKKREEFINGLMRVGCKMIQLNDNNFDLDKFIKEFVPSGDFLKKQICDSVESSAASVREAQNKEKQENVQSPVIEALKAQFMDFEKLLKTTNPCDEYEEDAVQVKPKTKQRQQVTSQDDNAEPDEFVTSTDCRCINHTIVPGEMSKIFVQKTRFDVVRSITEQPNFDDENLETIYIYRSKNC